jgi:putative FmdB family regulatory protein
MPVYEFYCADCHTVFNFLSRTVDTAKRPVCPRCARPDLERRISLFSISKGRKEVDEGGPEGLDEEAMERALESLSGELDGADEGDPRQMARLMRKLHEATGMSLGSGLEEAIRRMEAGEDPDRVEEEMGDLLEGEEPFTREGVNRIRRKLLPPAHDDTLYEL